MARDSLWQRKDGSRKNAAARIRVYRIVNWTLLGLVVYFLLLPVISPAMDRLMPGVWGQCAYRNLTGRPCPLCGLTHAFQALARADLQSARGYHRLVLFFASFMAVELIFRIVLLQLAPDPKRSALFRFDLAAHGVLLLLYSLYLTFTLS